MLFGCISAKIEKNPALIVRVVDGDTVKIESGESVRLIGIDSTERGEECFEEAKQKLAGLIESKIVYLEKDVEDKDKYGRLLRYIYLGNYFINLEMVKTGFAYAYEYPPSVRHSKEIAKAEEIAINENAGCLWPAG